jgi:hypothetical protein
MDASEVYRWTVLIVRIARFVHGDADDGASAFADGAVIALGFVAKMLGRLHR